MTTLYRNHTITITELEESVLVAIAFGEAVIYTGHSESAGRPIVEARAFIDNHIGDLPPALSYKTDNHADY